MGSFLPLLEGKMIGWIFFLAILTILSYLSDVGILMFMRDLRIPVVNASLVSLLLLLSMAGLLVRVLIMEKRAEKEGLKQRIEELEKELLAAKNAEK